MFRSRKKLIDFKKEHVKIKETDLAKALIESFDGTKYEIFQEVETYIGIADIVLKHSFIWAIEVKTSLSLQVIAQAWMNTRIYNFSSICVPSVRSSKGAELAHKICRDYGIGIFKIRHGACDEILKARFNRKAMIKSVRLVDQQKDFSEAGNANGERWTPFNQTVSELKRYIVKHPSCKLKDALTNIKHHYSSLSSAQNSIRQWIYSGVIQGIEINRGILTLTEDK